MFLLFHLILNLVLKDLLPTFSQKSILISPRKPIKKEKILDSAWGIRLIKIKKVDFAVFFVEYLCEITDILACKNAA